MTDEPLLRRATLDDAEGFVRAYELAWDATAAAIVGRRLDELMPFEARVEHYRSSFGQADHEAQAWVADESGEIVGVAVCRREGDAVELDALYVVPASWGTGLAARLMGAALEGMRGDAAEAFLWVGEDNARARRFYEREGWSCEGTTRTSSLGPVELRYRRSLAEPAAP